MDGCMRRDPSPGLRYLRSAVWGLGHSGRMGTCPEYRQEVAKFRGWKLMVSPEGKCPLRGKAVERDAWREGASNLELRILKCVILRPNICRTFPSVILASYDEPLRESVDKHSLQLLCRGPAEITATGQKKSKGALSSLPSYITMASHSITYDHTHLRTRHPVRSALDKQVRARLVVGWVTTSESLVLYVFLSFFLSSFAVPVPHWMFTSS
ncbi:hypothetical protein B0T22DRAFT_22334 [Podospora appendiculata]|uniref:Uncharacterized protein n=1 Tax=Podospora appendiculata TaxID=314037 RepID=A0AAE1CFI4_9PEZI|nr:hypothetical protein B0T22DRAFT_22334 [Podospora appendiculata]